MSDIKNKFSKRLLLARKTKGLTQQEVADEIGISRQMYANYEHGKITSLNLDTIIKLCVLLNASPDYLFLGKKTINLDAIKYYIRNIEREVAEIRSYIKEV